MTNAIHRPNRASLLIASVGAALLLAAYPRAQAPRATPSQETIADGPGFDVVSIRRSANDAQSFSRQTPTGGFIGTGLRVFNLLLSAYPPLPVPPKNVPDWTLSERYDVTATASLSSPPTPEQQQLMMRALLADRFQFAAHIEQTDQPVFDLVLARGDGKLGSGMTPLEADCVAMRLAENPTEIERRATLPLYDSGGPPCRVGMMWSSRTMMGDFTMATLAALVQTAAGRPVVDKTGLKGTFRVSLEADGLMAGGLNATGAPSHSPSIFSALPDQLGLKLESSRAMVETLVVDRIERPSEN